jgi:hypothetical protein
MIIRLMILGMVCTIILSNFYSMDAFIFDPKMLISKYRGIYLNSVGVYNSAICA